MDGQQIYALLGQWYDIVGAVTPGGGGGMGGMHRRRWRGRYGYGGYPMDDGFQQPAVDPTIYAYLQQLQLQLAQLQAAQQPAMMPPPAMPPSGPPGGHAMPPAVAQGWVNLIGQEIPGVPQGMPFPPRAALVDAPAPTQANRDILPMSTGVPILPTQSAQITGRPQVMAFKANTYKISDAGTAGGAADWIVNDIKIGNRSQFVQSGDVPGDVFGTRAIDTFVRFETAQTAMDIVVVVTYIGLNESGCPFFSAMIGTAAV